MSVWPHSGSPGPSLGGTEGELVSIRISIEPRLLEALLEVVARFEFPVNPEICHHAGGASHSPDAAWAYSDAAREPATIIEFPAWAGRLDEVREALARHGFHPSALTVRTMLEAIGHTQRGRANS